MKNWAEPRYRPTVFFRSRSDRRGCPAWSFGAVPRSAAVIDFDMKRFGLVPKVAVGMNYSLLGSPVFQRVLDVQEAIHG
jgi:hypothetical protein